MAAIVNQGHGHGDHGHQGHPGQPNIAENSPEQRTILPADDSPLPLYVIKYNFGEQGTGTDAGGHWGLFLLKSGTFSPGGKAAGYRFDIAVRPVANTPYVRIAGCSQERGLHDPYASGKLGSRTRVPIKGHNGQIGSVAPSELNGWCNTVIAEHQEEQYNLFMNNCHHWTFRVLEKAHEPGKRIDPDTLTSFLNQLGSPTNTDMVRGFQAALAEYRQGHNPRDFRKAIHLLMALGFEAAGVALGVVGSADRRTHVTPTPGHRQQ